MQQLEDAEHTSLLFHGECDLSYSSDSPPPIPPLPPPLSCNPVPRYGSNFAIYPTLTADIFGVSSAGPNYGLVFMAYGGVSFLVIILLARIKEVFLVCAGISLAGAVSILILWERQRRCNLRHPSISVSLM